MEVGGSSAPLARWRRLLPRMGRSPVRRHWGNTSGVVSEDMSRGAIQSDNLAFESPCFFAAFGRLRVGGAQDRVDGRMFDPHRNAKLLLNRRLSRAALYLVSRDTFTFVSLGTRTPSAAARWRHGALGRDRGA